MTAKIVLDASALLALLQGEPGADVVADGLTRSCITSVNLTEVLSKLIDRGAPEAAAVQTVDMLQLEIVAVDREIGMLAARLRPRTRSAGLSLGDRICLAAGHRLGATVLTADTAWTTLGLGLDVRQIR